MRSVLVLLAASTWLGCAAQVERSTERAPQASGVRAPQLVIREPKPPTYSTEDGGARIGNGPPTAERVARAMATGFNRCIEASTEPIPLDPPRHRLELRLGPNGEVEGAAFTAGEPLPKETAECILARARLAQFPERGDGHFVIEFDLVGRAERGR